MKQCVRAALAATILTLGNISSPASAYCIGWDKTLATYDPRYYSVSKEFARSEWVIKAKVLKETWIGEDGKEKPLSPPFQKGSPRPWGFDPYAGAFFDLKIERSFKGIPPSVIRVFSENATNRFWLDKGEEILAFVSAEEFEPPIGRQFTLDTCGNFRQYPKAIGVEMSVRKAAKLGH